MEETLSAFWLVMMQQGITAGHCLQVSRTEHRAGGRKSCASDKYYPG